ncbi:MAG: FAD-dependent oxidoreductase [Planctomycetaceae bacterium]
MNAKSHAIHKVARLFVLTDAIRRFAGAMCGIVLLTVFLLATAPAVAADGDERSVDIVVYGGTPAGVAAAVEASREGAKVLLVEPTGHVGGLVSSGLSHTDFRTFEGITGSYADFTDRVLKQYQETYGPESEQVTICRRGTHAEPHVAERVFLEMLKEHHVDLLTQHELASVEKTESSAKDGRSSITLAKFHATAQRASDVAQSATLLVKAKCWIDATYEGDLLAMAGVRWRAGREGRSEYQESLAPREADDQLQGYNFRFMMTRDPANRVTVAKPVRYNREEFVGILPLLEDGRVKQVFGYPSGCVFKAQIPTIPNGKFDINDVSQAPVRLSMPGENIDWPNGDAATRKRLFDRHLEYSVGLMWFLQNDAAVPEPLRTKAAEYGWCKDEFVDNSHLPWQLYVREARRMQGERVFIESDTDPAPNDARSRFHPDAIAMGDYGPNCHGTHHEGPRFGGKHTGEFYKRVAPYQIPYGVLLPKEVSNLLVPTACSASHVGFCALRLEPIWMSLGQAAGVAVRQSLTWNTPLHDLSPQTIRRALHRVGAATIYVSDIPRSSPLFLAVQQLGACGGLHGLHPPLATPGERGANIIGQYYASFPGHAFLPDALMDDATQQRWINLLPPENRESVQTIYESIPNLTRSKAVLVWHTALESSER